jgi:restriction system protein
MIVSMAILLAAKQPKPPDLVKPAVHGLLHSLLSLWPLWLLIGLIAVGKLAVELYRLRRLSLSGIAEIDAMDGRTFEGFLSTLFRRLGYSVEVTKYHGDYGADLVVKKDGRKTVVQAKRWTKRVGLKAVQEAVAAKAMYGCEAALVVANREFTQQARKLGRANKVELWDRDALVGKLLAVRGSATESVAPALSDGGGESGPTRATTLTAVAEPKAPASAPTSPEAQADSHCATCGATVSDKVRAYCLARPERFAGQVYCFKHQRGARTAFVEEA